MDAELRPDDPIALLRARLRAGEVSLEWLELLAFAGDLAARGVKECVCGPNWENIANCWHEGDQDEWFYGFLELLAKLPPVQREVECDVCGGEGILPNSPHMAAVGCYCRSGSKVLEISAARWWGVQVGLWCARAAYAFNCDCSDAIEGYGCPTCQNIGYVGVGSREIEHALGAVQRWLDEPTQERAGEWGNALGSVGAGEFLWLPRVWTGDHRTQLEAASDMIGSDRVRAVVLAGLQGVDRGWRVINLGDGEVSGAPMPCEFCGLDVYPGRDRVIVGKPGYAQEGFMHLGCYVSTRAVEAPVVRLPWAGSVLAVLILVALVALVALVI